MLGNCNSIAAHPFISIRLVLTSVSGADRFPVQDSDSVNKKTMLAWMRMSADKFSLEDQAQPVATGFLYRLTLAFPSWAGAILAVYSIFLSRFSALRVRLE
jgi:hypothetical protein